MASCFTYLRPFVNWLERVVVRDDDATHMEIVEFVSPKPLFRMRYEGQPQDFEELGST